MSCFENFQFNLNEFDWQASRNRIAAVVSGLLFALGIWLYIDVATIYTPIGQWNNWYLVVTLSSIFAMFMVNSISTSQLNDSSSYGNGCMTSRGARLWLMFAFILSFSSLVAALWLMFSAYVLVEGSDPKFPGVALFFNNFLIFCASLTYKFGRIEEDGIF